MAFNEDARVKIPAILHLVRLGYGYLSLRDKTIVWDKETNIFTDIFIESLKKVNQDVAEEDVKRLLNELSLLLDNEDLGRAFYERLTQKTGLKIIDFEHFENNTLNVVTELTYKNGAEEFRPDITLLINGLPLGFIEVKKPNNKEGIIAERKRINRRFSNKKFRRFVNITQLMVFSNNMEYDDNDLDTIQGAFYASPSYEKVIFNYFREEEDLDLARLLSPQNDELETKILKENNLEVINHSPSFLTNKEPNTPTNKLLTSLFAKNRLSFFLRYAIAYVNENRGLQKHVMRYPQFFATKAIENKLKRGIRKGIVWHTQGSGKTALAYYNVRFLTDYFQKQHIIPKFYFIVDRLDLFVQAKKEFTSRGLTVHAVNSRNEFVVDIKSKKALHNERGNAEITVVNIQKFSEDAQVVTAQDYDVHVQRIYFLDEVHRSYNPKGSFLANLEQSDKKAIKIGLTGTPLLGQDYNSKILFGDYIHKYYYNASIADGYTLKLIREEITSNYKIKLAAALENIKVLKGVISKDAIYAHESFVVPMLDYILDDFEMFRSMNKDESLGGMVVCHSSKQAEKLQEVFNANYRKETADLSFAEAAEYMALYRSGKKSYKVKTTALILHDTDTKQDREQRIAAFKAGKIDLLFVYNMLLTGFDAPRLKKLYMGRVIKKHNLLQALTRVNRTYKGYKYGFVVDFADIKSEFDKTNKAYFDELQEVLGDDMKDYADIFKSVEEIEEEIEEIKEVLFYFDTQNEEIFSRQISEISDRKKVLELVKALGNAKHLYNLIRLLGHDELSQKLDFKKLAILHREADNHLQLLNQKEALENQLETTNLLNLALEDVVFSFKKIGEEELKLADELKNTLRITREALERNFDKKDPDFISLYEELKRLFKEKKLEEVTQAEMKANIGTLKAIHAKILELNRQNRLLQEKYNNDPKYCRIHKRLREKGTLTQRESQLFEVLQSVKLDTDDAVLKNSSLLKNEGYFDGLMGSLIIKNFKTKSKIDLDAKTAEFVNHLVVKEYMNAFNGHTG